ncbi:CPBP family glutamic-type intramembrane protease [Halorarius halobius]|uniref:CPBP family glutamic-type intramembrane protease n=1 Tax=Halorarius halobius TaxID=2962671 RepID=UPI0020CB6C46|nr:CPBP family glutamic-type intramembrane protease [Halorarius halobius]
MLPARSRLNATVAPLSGLGARWALASLAPLGVTLVVITAIFTATAGADPGLPPGFPTLVYGVANVVVLLGVYRRLDPDVWDAIALARPPSRRELGAGLAATTVGVAVGWPATTLVAEAIGVARYSVPSLSGVGGLASLFVGAVVVAPIAEEILFRGLLFGLLLDRGYGPLVAGTGSLVVFAAIHVFTAGVGSVVNALLLGALLTWLRLQFDNLVGAWLMHMLNNLLEFLIAASLLPSLYAL